MRNPAPVAAQAAQQSVTVNYGAEAVLRSMGLAKDAAPKKHTRTAAEKREAQSNDLAAHRRAMEGLDLSNRFSPKRQALGQLPSAPVDEDLLGLFADEPPATAVDPTLVGLFADDSLPALEAPVVSSTTTCWRCPKTKATNGGLWVCLSDYGLACQTPGQPCIGCVWACGWCITDMRREAIARGINPDKQDVMLEARRLGYGGHKYAEAVEVLAQADREREAMIADMDRAPFITTDNERMMGLLREVLGTKGLAWTIAQLEDWANEQRKSRAEAQAAPVKVRIVRPRK